MGEPDLDFSRAPEKVFLVGLYQRGDRLWEVKEHLSELSRLAWTAGAEVAGQVVLRRDKPHPGYFIGEGQASIIGEQVEEEEIDTVIFDDDLSPAQGRNLEKKIGVKVLDRTQLILDIFARHAATRAGRLQIELAQMKYTLPRLRRMWTHLERQKGGIGLRGPGEQQIEVDRRRIEERIDRLRTELEQVRRRRAEQRKGRRRHGWALVSLVGYTNAGKSTLLNQIAGADVEAYDKLFATLDPTTRRVKLPNNQYALITDTVGFIRKLPHGLIESFKATLEEVSEADLLVHVVDAAHPEVDSQIDAVNDVLREISADEKPVLVVLNKIDNAKAMAHCKVLEKRFGRCVWMSARRGDGVEEFFHALADALKHRNTELKLRIPLSEGALIARLHASANILHADYQDGHVDMRARVPKRLLGEVSPFHGKDTDSEDV